MAAEERECPMELNSPRVTPSPQAKTDDLITPLGEAWMTLSKKQAGKEDCLVDKYIKLFRMTLQVLTRPTVDMTMRGKLLGSMRPCHIALGRRFPSLKTVYITLCLISKCEDNDMFLEKINALITLAPHVLNEKFEEQIRALMTIKIDPDMDSEQVETDYRQRLEAPEAMDETGQAKKARVGINDEERQCGSPARDFSTTNNQVQPWLASQEQVVPDRPPMDDPVFSDNFLEQLNLLYEDSLSTNTLSKFCKTIADLTCHRGVKLGWQFFRLQKGPPACTEALVSTLLVKDLMNPNSAHCCTRDLMVLWCRVLKHRQISPQEIARIASKFVARRSDVSGHFYLMFDVIFEECGATNIPVLVELMLRGMGVDLNGIEEAKLLGDNDLREDIEVALGKTLLKTAGIFEDYPLVMREFVFSSFTVHPTKEALELLKGLSLRICENRDPACHCFGHRLDEMREPQQIGRPQYELLPHDDMYFFEPILDASIPGVDFETLEDIVTVLHAVRSPCFSLKDDWEAYFTEFYSTGRGSTYRTEIRRLSEAPFLSANADGSEDSESDSESSVNSTEFRKRLAETRKEATLGVRPGRKAAGACHKLKTKEKTRPPAARRSARQLEKQIQNDDEDDEPMEVDCKEEVASPMSLLNTVILPQSSQQFAGAVQPTKVVMVTPQQLQRVQLAVADQKMVQVVMNGPKIQVAGATLNQSTQQLLVPQTTSMTPVAINTALMALQVPGQEALDAIHDAQKYPSSQDQQLPDGQQATHKPTTNRMVLNRFDSLCNVPLNPPSLLDSPIKLRVCGGPMPKLANVLIRNPKKLPSVSPSATTNSRQVVKNNALSMPPDPTRGKISADLLRRLKEEVDNRCSGAPITQFFKHQQRKPIFTNKKEVAVKFSIRKQGPVTQTAPTGQVVPSIGQATVQAISNKPTVISSVGSGLSVATANHQQPQQQVLQQIPQQPQVLPQIKSINNLMTTTCVSSNNITNITNTTPVTVLSAVQGATVGGGGGVKPEVKVEGGSQVINRVGVISSQVTPPGPTISVVHAPRPGQMPQQIIHQSVNQHTTRPLVKQSPVVVTTCTPSNQAVGIKSGSQIVRHVTHVPGSVAISALKDGHAAPQNVLMKILTNQSLQAKVEQPPSVVNHVEQARVATSTIVQSPSQTLSQPTVISNCSKATPVVVTSTSQQILSSMTANSESLKLVQSAVQQVLSNQRLTNPNGTNSPVQVRVRINTPTSQAGQSLGQFNQVSLQVPTSTLGATPGNPQQRIVAGKIMIPVNSLLQQGALATSVNGMPVIILKNQATGQQQIVQVQQVQPGTATTSLAAPSVQTVQVVQRPVTPSQTPPPQSPQFKAVAQAPMGAVVIKQQIGTSLAQVLKNAPKQTVVVSQPGSQTTTATSTLNRVPIQVTVPVSAPGSSVVVTNTAQPQKVSISAQPTSVTYTLSQNQVCQSGEIFSAGGQPTVTVAPSLPTVSQAQPVQQVLHIANSSAGGAVSSQTIVVSQAGQRLVTVPPDVLQAAVKSGQTKIITYKPALQQSLVGGKAKVVAAEVIGSQKPTTTTTTSTTISSPAIVQKAKVTSVTPHPQATAINVQSIQKPITSPLIISGQQIIRVHGPGAVQFKRVITPTSTLQTQIVPKTPTPAPTPVAEETSAPKTIVSTVKPISESDRLREITPVLDEDALMEQIMAAEVKEQMQTLKRSLLEQVSDDPAPTENGAVDDRDEKPRKRRRLSDDADDLRSVSDALKFAIMSETGSMADDELDPEVTIENEMSVTLPLSSGESEEGDTATGAKKRRRRNRSGILTESALQEHNKRTQTAAQALIAATADKIMENANKQQLQPVVQMVQPVVSTALPVSNAEIVHNGKILVVPPPPKVDLENELRASPQIDDDVKPPVQIKQMIMVSPSIKAPNSPLPTTPSTTSPLTKKKGPYTATTKEEQLAQQSRYKCHECNRGFFSAYNQRRHLKNVHKIDVPAPSPVPQTPQRQPSHLLAALNGGNGQGSSSVMSLNLNDSDHDDASLDPYVAMNPSPASSSTTTKNALTSLLEAPPVNSTDL